MSTPSDQPSKDSVSATSPYSGSDALEDTASSVVGMGAPPRVSVQFVRADAPLSAPTQAILNAPNTTYARRLRNVRSHSVSPRPRRTFSPSSLSVAQRRAQTAEMKADTALSHAGALTDQTIRAQSAAAEAISTAQSVREQVESRMMEFSRQAEISASSAKGEMVEQLERVVAQTEAQTSHTAARVVHQLEQDIQVAASSATATSENLTRAAVADVRRDIQAQLEQNRADSQRRDAESKVKVDKIAADLATLTEQLNQFKPASTSDVMGSQLLLSSTVEDRLSLQSQRIDTVSESAQQAHKTAQDNAEILHTLLVGMENLGENVKQLREQIVSWEEPGEQEVLDDLLKEVPLVPLSPEQSQPIDKSPTVTAEIPVMNTPTLFPPSTGPVFAFTDAELQEMQKRVAALKNPEKEQWVLAEGHRKPYPGAPVDVPGSSAGVNQPNTTEEQPRRITPIPVSIPISPIMTPAEVGKRFRERDAQQEEQFQKLAEKFQKEREKGTETKSGDNEDQDQSSGTNGSTIGHTYIPPAEGERIQNEVRATVHQMFPGIHMSTIHNSKFGKSGMSTVNQASSEETSEPLAIAGSEVSVASTSNNGGNAVEFSRLSQQVGAAAQPQPFATAQWKPKEPPCFYGRSSEDVHTWTSLVRHYLAFMGGSDAQQVSYAVTLLREHAHEWFMGYERRNHHLPRDWASLASALLERFGSNIRSQEAQSQLMSVSQGTRPVREYASQFELLMGRLDSFDEGMLLNQFIWGLQPELARSVSLHYPKSIAQAVSLAETTELATKASRRPMAKGGQSGRAPMQQNRGRGQWRGNRGRSGRRGGGGRSTYRGGNRGGRGSTGSVNFDPLACYQCGVRGHLARNCPQSGAAQSQGSGNAVPSRGSFMRSGQKGPRGRGRGRSVRFGGLNVLYDEAGNEYPVDDAGQLYVPLGAEQAVIDGVNEEEIENPTKN